MDCPKCNAPIIIANANRCGKCFASLTAGTAAIARPGVVINHHALFSGLLTAVQIGVFLMAKAQADAHRTDDATPFLVGLLLLTVINFAYSGYAAFGRHEPRWRWVGRAVFFAHCLLVLWVLIVVVYRIKRGF